MPVYSMENIAKSIKGREL